MSDSHGRREPHHAAPAEAPVEMLPPISGGVARRRRRPRREVELAAPSVVRRRRRFRPADGRRVRTPRRAASHRTRPIPVASDAGRDLRPVPSPTTGSPTRPRPAARRPSRRRSPRRAGRATAVERRARPRRAVAEPAATGDHCRRTADGRGAPSSSRRPRQRPPSEPAARAPAAPAGPGGRPRPPKQGGQGKSESSAVAVVAAPPGATPPPPPTPPKPHPADALLAQLAYVIVNEAGASVYSTSQVGRDELPDFDATLRSTISIGRRLQDPLAELVKIEPQNIGVGLYQHDVNPKQLKETLESVISSCVNFVGVDLNTASVPLLRHVSGLNQLTARRIVDYRKEQGPFADREQLMRGRGDRPGDVHAGGRLPQDPRGREPARPDLGPSRELPGRDQAAREARVRARRGPRQGPAARAATRSWRRPTCPALAARAGGRRVHAPRHHRGPGPARARPARRPAQADLQEGRPQDRGPEPPAWS